MFLSTPQSACPLRSKPITMSLNCPILWLPLKSDKLTVAEPSSCEPVEGLRKCDTIKRVIPSSCTTVRSLVTQASIVLRSSILFSCEDTSIEMWSNTINRQPRARTRYRIRLIIFSIVLEPKWSKKKNREVPKV